MNIPVHKAFLLAVAANIIGGLLVIGIMACHARHRTGTWRLGDGF